MAFRHALSDVLREKGIDSPQALEAAIYPPEAPAKSPEAGQRSAQNWFHGRSVPNRKNLRLIGRRLELDPAVQSRLESLRQDVQQARREMPHRTRRVRAAILSVLATLSVGGLGVLGWAMLNNSALSYCLATGNTLTTIPVRDTDGFTTTLRLCEEAVEDRYDADAWFLIGRAKMVETVTRGLDYNDPDARDLVREAFDALDQAARGGHANAMIQMVHLYELGAGGVSRRAPATMEEAYELLVSASDQGSMRGVFCRAVYEIFRNMGNRPPTDTLSDLQSAADAGLENAATLLWHLADTSTTQSRLNGCAPIHEQRPFAEIPERCRRL